MNYYDASQPVSPEAGSEPPASADAIAPGSVEPISGDALSEVGATIAGVTGPGGSDNTFDAEGNLVVQGQYGTLTIDAQGNYTYVPNPGTPEGVQDVFTYTFTDSSGATSTATLTIAVGGAADATANAGETTTAANGTVINLPAGVDISDIRVSGGDLIISLPDGTQMVIQDGALFVPRLVSGDIEIPQTSLAALLIDSEPEPESGPPLSSGGNFAVDTPPLDPGVPLGDLIPPTELTDTPPEVEEVNQFLDTEPTVIIVTPDNPAGAINATAQVDESGLAARTIDGVAEPEGTEEPTAIETTTGTIVLEAQDGLDSVTINGVVVTAVGQQIVGANGILTITSISDTEIGYSYTVTDNTTDGVDDFDDFTVVVTDNDGDTATATLHIDIADDEPVAHDDTGAQGDDGGPITVNVFANDVEGADGVTLGNIAYVEGSLTGQGTVAYNDDGTFTYTPAPGEEGVITFQYQIIDGDGDPSIATVTITLNPDSIPTISLTGDQSVDEAGLPARGEEPAGSGESADGNSNDNDDPSETVTGTINIGTGSDSVQSLVINGVDVTGGGTVQGQYGTLTVTLNQDGSYGYSYTLADNTSGNSTSDNFSVVITDSDGDTASTNLNIDIIDDVPTAHDDFGTQGDDGGPITVNVFANDVEGADGVTLGNIAYVAGSLTGQGTVAYNDDGTFTYTPAPGEEGVITFQYQITDGDGDTSIATVTITLNPDSIPTISLTGDQSVDEAGLPARGEEPAGSGESADGNSNDNDDPSETVTGTINIGTGSDSVQSLVINGVDVTGGGTVQGQYGTLTVTLNQDGSYGYSYTLADNTSGNSTSDNFSVVITDSDGDTASTNLNIDIIDDVPTAANDEADQSPENATITVNVFANDTPGADGVDLSNVAEVFLVEGTLSGTGTLVYNEDGTFTYTPSAGEEGDVTFQYTIVDGDGDTSTATVTIHLEADSVPAAGDATASVDDEGLPGGIVGGDGDLVVANDDGDNDESTSSGTLDVAFGGDGPGTVTFADMDGETATIGQEDVVYSWDADTNTLTATVDGGDRDGLVLFTVAVDPTTGAYDVTLVNNVLQLDDGTNSENDATAVLTFTATDSDGSTDQGTLTLTLDDDIPTATDEAAQDVAEGSTATGTFDFAPGADGAIVTAINGTALVFGEDGWSQPVSLSNGSIVVKADGSYEFTPTDPTGGTANVTGTFTVTDGDGDEVTADFEFNVTDAHGPTAGASEASVDDEGLPGGIVGGDGDLVVANDDGDNDESTSSGTLDVAFGGDGPGTVTFADMDGETATIGQEDVVYSWDADTNTLTATVDGGDRDGLVLFTVAVDPTTGAYDVTLVNNVLQLDDGTNSENDATAVLTFTATDSDGSTDQGTLTLTLDDDIPTATDEAAQDVAEGSTATGTFDFAPGADGAIVTAINGTALVFGEDGWSQPVSLSNGSIVVKADGSYEFTPTDPTGGTANVTGTFTVTDGDGDEVTADFEFNVTDAHGPTAGASEASVDDEGLPGGIVGGDGDLVVANDDGDNDESTSSGTLDVAFGGDGPGTVTFADMDGETATIGQEDVVYSWDADTNTLTATVDGGDRDGLVLFTVAVDPTTGAYDVTLVNNVLQLDDGTNSENDATAVLTFTATDSDGSTDQGTLTLTLDDDIPTATDEAAQDVAEGSTATGTFDFAPGADGAIVTAINGTALVFGEDGWSQPVSLSNGSIVVKADGSYEFTPTDPTGGTANVTGTFTVTDGDGDEVTADFEFNVTDAHGPTAGASEASVDDEGLPGGIVGGDGDLVVANDDGDNDESTSSGTLDVAFGGDGPGTVTFADMDGETATIGQEDVVYSWDADTNTLTATVDGGDRDGLVLFTVAVDPTTGAYDVTLVNNVLQLDDGTNSENDATAVLTFTATDSDGSTDQGTLTLTLDDDIPTAFETEAVVLDNDSGIASGSIDFADDGDGDIKTNYGADGGTVRFNEDLETTPTGLTSGGEPITYLVSEDGLTLYGMVGTDEIFRIVLDPSTSEYTVTMDGHVDSKSDVEFFDGSYDFTGGNDPWAGFVPDGQAEDKGGTPLNDDSQDLLITPFSATGDGDFVNMNANSAGAGGGGGGQNVGTDEGLRLDFVVDLTGDPAGSPSNYDGSTAQQDHDFDEHYEVNDVSLRFGDGSSNTTIALRAYDATENVADSVLGNGTLVSITEIVINFDGESQVFTLDPDNLILTFTVGSPGGLADRSYTVEFVEVSPGVYTVEVTGILDEDVRIATHGETDYEALEIEHLSGDDFALTGFGASVETTDPVNFTVPVEIVDGDGDVVAGTDLGITLNPEGTTSTPLTIQSSTQMVQSDSADTGLVPSNDNGDFHRAVGGRSNPALIGAIAAAGLAETGVVLGDYQPLSGIGHSQMAEALPMVAQAPAAIAAGQAEAGILLQQPGDSLSAPTAPHGGGRFQDTDGQPRGMTDSNAKSDGPGALQHGTDAPAHGQQAAGTSLTAGAVAMPSADQLIDAAASQVAPADGSLAGSSDSVGKVLADALHGGEGHGPNLDALINALPGHGGGANAALEALASHGAATVPNGHMADFASFAGSHNVAIVDDMAHQDALPPNG